ncbi:hypothetical protein Tco_1286778 [Tanacetum coccineum]
METIIISRPVMTKDVNSQGQKQLLAYCLITWTEVDIGKIIYSDLITKLLNKYRQKYVSYHRFYLFALQVLLDPDYTQDENVGFLPGILSNSKITKDPSKVTDIELTAHMIAVNGQKDSVNAKPRHILKEVTRDRRLRETYHLADITNTTPLFTSLLGLGAKYQVDQTQSTRLRYQSLTKNKGKPSHEGELDTQPLVLSTYADVRAFLLSDDEAQESKEDILGAGEEMDEEPQAASIAETHHQSPPPQADKPQSSHAPSTEASDTDSSCDDILKKYDNILPLTER